MAAKIKRKFIYTPKAPEPVTRYSQAVLVDKTLYVAGQIGADPATMEIVEGGTVAEAEQALKNIGQILEASGSSYDKVVKVTVFFQSLKDYDQVNQVYCKYFSNCKPARSAFQVAALPKGAKIEIDVTAVTGEVEDV